MTTTGGRVRVGERLPTLEDVARLAGVSRATVSRVINGIRNVDPQLHELVWDAVGRTGYVPNRLARSLVTRRTGTIALVVSDSEAHDDDPFMGRFFADPYFGRVVGGLMSVLRAAGIQLALQIVGTEDQRTRLVGDLRHGQADGVVVLSLPGHDPLPRMLTDAGVPAVMIGRPADPVPINYVDLANDAGAALAADHLVARGCQLIGMIAGPADVPASSAPSAIRSLATKMPSTSGWSASRVRIACSPLSWVKLPETRGTQACPCRAIERRKPVIRSLLAGTSAGPEIIATSWQPRATRWSAARDAPVSLARST